MATSQASQCSIRLAAIEPLEPFKAQVQKIADQFGLGLSTEDQECESAPFCGYDMYSQNMILTPTQSDSETASQRMLSCIGEIEKLAEEDIADGYVELID